MENKEKIKSITVVTQQGTSSHWVGNDGVHEIKEENVFIQGDPFLHYIGRDKDKMILFKINALCPVEVIYFKTSDNGE